MNTISQIIESVADLNERAEGQIYIYELYKGSECIYVGQTRSLNKRLVTHRADKEFDSVKVQICNKSEANAT